MVAGPKPQLASGAGTRRYQLPRALAWPRKTAPPEPQSPAMHGRGLFCGSNCLSNRSQLRAAMGGIWARVIAGHLQKGPREPGLGLPSPAGTEPILRRLHPESLQRLNTKGLGRSLIKAALFSLGVLIGYYRIHFIPNLHSLARQRMGAG